jgi:MurNAc alpha-1-phosphate uridylyltransferase
VVPVPTQPPITAMVLAAGRGERMRPLTDTTPKPLLRVQGKPLLQWHVDALAHGGFNRIVINTAWLGQQISDYFGHQPLCSLNTPLSISYSHEGLDFGGALETAGGIARALTQLGDAFWLLAGDIFAPEFAFSASDVAQFMASGHLAHLWLVPNPEHNPQGDFGLAPDPHHPGRLLAVNQNATPEADKYPQYTYSTIGLYRRALFEPPWCNIPGGNPQGTSAKLAPLLRRAMDAGRVGAELYTGAWTDVGTPQRLAALNAAQGLRIEA